MRDAAYQVRSRELDARAAVERTQRAIDRARARGEATVVIWSEGERELWPPYRRVEMSVATGRALSLTTELDPERMRPRFALEALQLDPETGEALDEPPLAPRADLHRPRGVAPGRRPAAVHPADPLTRRPPVPLPDGVKRNVIDAHSHIGEIAPWTFYDLDYPVKPIVYDFPRTADFIKLMDGYGIERSLAMSNYGVPDPSSPSTSTRS